MRNKGIITIVACMIVLCWGSPGYTLKEDTHRAMNEYIAQNTVNGYSLNNYLIYSLGFSEGYKERIQGDDADGVNSSKKIFEWLGHGGIQEDRPGELNDFVPWSQTRSVNHFHNPLKPWNEAGLNDIYSGQSSILWAQNTSQNLGGNWNWYDARRYFYIALTGRDLNGISIPMGKEHAFAMTFRAVGQLMHLVEDVSVPEHARNDAHIWPAYEDFLDKLRVKKTDLWNNWINNPISFDKAILNISSANTPVAVPISRIIDSDRYDGINPDITNTSLGSLNAQAVGLSEYTNANFLSPDTMLTDDLPATDKHAFPYPKKSSAIIWNDPTNKRDYLKKIGDGDSIDHLAVKSLWHDYRWLYFPQEKKSLPLGLDDKCKEEYASKLIPRAVGYSAGLLDYFFRGTLGISFPSSVVYSIADGSKTPYYDVHGNPHQQFTKLKAMVMNTTPNDEAIKAGTLTAVARYKIIPNYTPDLSNYPPDGAVMRAVPYSYSVSLPTPVNEGDIIPGYYTDFPFDFSNAPIPVGITDLTLQVVFKGTIGNETDNAIAVGMKDLMEPTHLTVWNSSDMFDLQYPPITGPSYSLYLFNDLKQIAAGDDNLRSLLDGNNSGTLEDDPILKPFNSTFTISFWDGFDWIPATTVDIPPAGHIRVIALVDSEKNNYVEMEYTYPGGSNSVWKPFIGVVNQADQSGKYSGATPVKTFRKRATADGTFVPFYQHFSTMVVGCYPVQVTDINGNPISCPYADDAALPIQNVMPVAFTSAFE